MRNVLSMVSVLSLSVCFLSGTSRAMEEPDENRKSSFNRARKTSSTTQNFDVDKSKNCPNCGQIQKEDKISLFINKLAFDSLNEQVDMVCSSNIELVKKIQFFNKLENMEETNQHIPNNFDGRNTCPNCGHLTCKALEKKLKELLIINNNLQNVIKTVEEIKTYPHFYWSTSLSDGGS